MRHDAEAIDENKRQIKNKIAAAQKKTLRILIRRLFREFPDDISLLTDLTLKCISLKDFDSASVCMDKAAALDPDYFLGHYLRAYSFHEQDDLDNALRCLSFILSRYQLSDHNNYLVHQLLALTYKKLGKVKECMDSCLLASRFAADPKLKPSYYSDHLMLGHYLEDFSAEELFARHAEYNAFFQDIAPFKHKRKKRGAKINVGYISPDFRLHVVTYFSYQLLSKYDKSRFTVTCYSRNRPDPVTRELQAMIDRWRDISELSDDETAQLIYDDEIDILFDLAGHSANNCLPVLARKPAPVQVSGIGYINTTGLSAVDYFLTDKYCDPPGQNDAYFTEKLVRLPHSHFCYTPPDTMPDAEATVGRNGGNIVFGSFNNFYKITDAMLGVWLAILNRVPGSKLILKSPHFDLTRDQQDVKLRAAALGYQDAQLEIRPASRGHLKEYNEIDIALDTYPYQGGGTTFEALYMGVPVITLTGVRHGSRFGYSILKNLGVEDGIAFTPDEYIERAARLARDKARLKELHQTLRARMSRSPLMDGKLYLRQLETEYEKMWNAHVAERETDAGQSVSGEKETSRAAKPAGQAPGETEALYQNALRLIDAGDGDAAAARIEQIIGIDPLYSPAYIALAKLYRLRGQRDEEIEILQSVLSLLDAQGVQAGAPIRQETEALLRQAREKIKEIGTR